MKLEACRSSRWGPGRLAGWALAGALLCCGAAAQAQTLPGVSPEVLTTSVDTTATLAPGESKLYTLELASGVALPLRIEQMAGSVELTAQPGAADAVPRTNPAGLHASVAMLMLLPPGTPANRVEHIAVRNLSKTKPAEIALHIAASHEASSQDRQQAEAETAFAQAEAVRLARTVVDYGNALAAYDRAIVAWRMLGDRADLSRALAWKALFLFVNRNDPASARPLAEEAVAHPGELDAAEAANCFKIAGYIHVQLALYDAGRDNYERAIAIYEQTGDVFNQEVLFDNLSRVERLEGHTDAALAAAGRAEALAAQLGDGLRQLKIKAEIGAIELSASRLQEAYVAYQEALVLARATPEPTTEGYVWSDLGVLYTMLQQPIEARNALDQAMEIWKGHPSPAGEINTLDDYGELWMSQAGLSKARMAQARVFYQRGLTLARDESLARPEVYLLRGLGATYLLEGDLANAQQSLDQSQFLALKVQEGDALPEIYCLTGDLHARRQELPAAEAAYLECGKTAAAAKDDYNGIRANGSLARLRMQEGQLDSAEQFSEHALAAIEATRTSLPEQDLRTSFFASMRSYYELAIDILERLDRLHPGQGYQWSAFLTAERARARMLLDQVQDHAVASSAMWSEYLDVETALRRQQHTLGALSRRAPAAKRQQLEDAVARLTVEDHALAAEAAAAPAGDSDSEALTPASLEAELPDEHATLVEFWTGQQGSYLWAFTRKEFRCFRLPKASVLSGAVAAFSRLLLAPAAQNPTATAEERARQLPRTELELDRQAASLRGVLFPVHAITPGTRTLLIAADGPLDSLAFAALLRGSSTAPAGREICSTCVLVAEPSATFLHHLLARDAPSHRPERVAIFIEANDNPGSPWPSQDRGASASELPFTVEEAQGIRGIFGQTGSRILWGRDASPEAIRTFSWAGYTIGHFAAHAELNRSNLQLSGLLLQSPDQGGGRDASTLWYGDICRLHAPLELVVLSACNTAGGEEIPGEGLVGLTQAFFTAGAQRVLGSLWAVDDQATALLMKYFYASLRSTRSPTLALRQAQTQMAATQQWHLPYYWAGFSLAGDWRRLP
jgi:CHAT domain-containing protein/tetratricopeptide (TPR) repeat protein